MKTKISIIALTLIAFSAQAAIQLQSNAKDGLVEFEAVGRPSMLKIKGVGEGATSKLQIENNALSGDIAFKLKSLKTGMDLRDDHLLNKYLQVGQFSEAKLTFDKLILPKNFNLTNPGIDSYPFKAILSLHGVKKEVSGVFSVQSALLTSTANFEIKLSDFNIEIPSYLGVKVADIVKIKVSTNKMVKVN